MNDLLAHRVKTLKLRKDAPFPLQQKLTKTQLNELREKCVALMYMDALKKDAVNGLD